MPQLNLGDMPLHEIKETMDKNNKTMKPVAY